MPFQKRNLFKTLIFQKNQAGILNCDECMVAGQCACLNGISLAWSGYHPRASSFKLSLWELVSVLDAYTKEVVIPSCSHVKNQPSNPQHLVKMTHLLIWWKFDSGDINTSHWSQRKFLDSFLHRISNVNRFLVISSVKLLSWNWMFSTNAMIPILVSEVIWHHIDQFQI